MSGDFPPLEEPVPDEPPDPVDPFLGREAELAEVASLLASSRHAPAHAHRAGRDGQDATRRYRRPVAPRTATRTASGGSRLRRSGTPSSSCATAAQVVGSKNGLAEHIADKAMLLPLRQLRAVRRGGRRRSPSCSAPARTSTLLVTSREPLHVTGEQEYPVPPLRSRGGGRLLPARARAVEAGLRGRRGRLRDLPPPRRPAAGARAGRRARQGSHPPAQILERLEQRLPLLTGGARDAARAPADAASDDRVVATTCWRDEEQQAVRPALRLRRRLHARGRRGGL